MCIRDSLGGDSISANVILLSRCRIGNYKVIESPVKLNRTTVCRFDHGHTRDEKFQKRPESMSPRHVRVNNINIFIANQPSDFTQFRNRKSFQIWIDKLYIQRLLFNPRVGSADDRHTVSPPDQLLGQEFAISERTVNLLTGNNLQNVQTRILLTVGGLFAWLAQWKAG